jgi:Ca2+:H+ antiporter
MDGTNNEATRPTADVAFQHLVSPAAISDYSNILFSFVPLGIVAGALQWDPRTVFTFNFIALVPTARVFSSSSQQLWNASGRRIARASGATLCNGIEMIVGLHLPSYYYKHHLKYNLD